MKKIFKIVSIVFTTLLIIMIVGVSIERWNEAPTQSIAFLNTADVMRNITFERIEEDGTLEGLYTIDSDIKPNQMLIERVPVAKYKVSVWNQDSTLYKSIDYEVKLEDPNKSNYQLYRFDLAMDKIYAIVNLNALYEGKSFAEYMANVTSNKQEKLKIEKFYDGSLPFFVSETYVFRTFVDVDNDIPKKVKYGEVVYGLFSFPKSLDETEIETAIFKQIFEKID